MFQVTVEFKEVGGKTKMDMTMALKTAEAAAETKKFIKKAGGNSTWDRLAEFLEEETTHKDIFVINRTFEAPVNTMFEMFADPKHLAKWLPPTGMTMEYVKAEIKPGGTSFYSMSSLDGKMKMFGKIHYQEIAKPNRLVYTQVFSDEKGNISRHPMAPTWPETMLTTITLEAESTNSTRVHIKWEVVGNATAVERATFHKEKGGMTQGWTGSFDKLEDYLAKQS